VVLKHWRPRRNTVVNFTSTVTGHSFCQKGGTTSDAFYAPTPPAERAVEIELYSTDPREATAPEWWDKKRPLIEAPAPWIQNRDGPVTCRDIFDSSRMVGGDLARTSTTRGMSVQDIFDSCRHVRCSP